MCGKMFKMNSLAMFNMFNRNSRSRSNRRTLDKFNAKMSLSSGRKRIQILFAYFFFYNFSLVFCLLSSRIVFTLELAISECCLAFYCWNWCELFMIRIIIKLLIACLDHSWLNYDKKKCKASLSCINCVNLLKRN